LSESPADARGPFPAIRAAGLRREYAPGRGIAGLALQVPAGECFAVLGRNGSGKSTLTRLLLGLERPDAGELEVLGRRLHRGSGGPGLGPARRQTAAVLDQCAHWEALSAWDNAWFTARCYGVPPADLAHRLEELFLLAGLEGRSRDPVRAYSFGMRRKLALVQALSVRPALLVLDEPIIGLDPQFQLALSESIQSRTRGGLTTWISGNCPEWLEAVAGRVAFLEGGKIAACGAVQALIGEVRLEQELRLTLRSPRRLQAPGMRGLKRFLQEGTRVSVILENDPLLIPRILEHLTRQGSPPATLEVRPCGLKEAFLLRTGRGLEE
jgi:ABC-type multidrug transport system ATPase subunit